MTPETSLLLYAIGIVGLTILASGIIGRRLTLEKPIDEIGIGGRVEVTTAPWAGEFGTIESIDGAYHIVRLDSSKHPDDVKELYPNEFRVIR